MAFFPLFFFPLPPSFSSFLPTLTPTILQYVLRTYGVSELNLVTESDMKGKTQDVLGICYKAGCGEGTWNQRKPPRGSYYPKEKLNSARKEEGKHIPGRRNSSWELKI